MSGVRPRLVGSRKGLHGGQQNMTNPPIQITSRVTCSEIDEFQEQDAHQCAWGLELRPGEKDRCRFRSATCQISVAGIT